MVVGAVGEALSLQRDLEEWCEEKARYEGEVHRAREMEREAYERFEVSQSVHALTYYTREGGRRSLAVAVCYQ